jgi:hypothetical protein
VPLTGAEKESLHASLDRHRDVVLWKVDGLDDASLRRPMTPSGTTLLGLVKHLAAVELGWFCETFGRETEPLPFDPDDDDDADLRVGPDESPSGGGGPPGPPRGPPPPPPTGSSTRPVSTRPARPGPARRSRCAGC